MIDIPSPMSPDARRAVAKIGEISGQSVGKCMQCGTCSAVCPMVDSMKMTTRQGMHLLQLGRVEEVIDAKITEFCASCHTCVVRCPREIDVPRVYEAVRLLVLRQNTDLVHPSEIPEEVLGEAPPIAMVSAFRKLTS